MARDPLKPVKVRAAYLGGLPGEKGSERQGNLFVSPTGIGWGAFKPSKATVGWADVRGVSFESGTAAKSRAPGVVAFGVLGLAGKSTQKDAHFTVFLRNGNAAIFHVLGVGGPYVRAKVQSFLTAAGVPCLDDQPETTPAPTPVSKADELAKLASLHDSGLLTDDEFATEKAKLLNG